MRVEEVKSCISKTGEFSMGFEIVENASALNTYFITEFLVLKYAELNVIIPLGNLSQ